MERTMRPRHEMPGVVWSAIVEHGLEDAYRSRPPYQQNDYIGWIMSAKREETRLKRLSQMLEELRQPLHENGVQAGAEPVGRP